MSMTAANQPTKCAGDKAKISEGGAARNAVLYIPPPPVPPETGLPSQARVVLVAMELRRTVDGASHAYERQAELPLRRLQRDDEDGLRRLVLRPLT